MLKPERTIIHVRVSDLKPFNKNPRTHSTQQVRQIAKSIRKFGFTNPVLIDEDNRVIAGHGRIIAAVDLDLEEVPCIRLNDLTEAEKRAYLIADNKLTLNGAWNVEYLGEHFEALQAEAFDVSLTGFELPEVDVLLTNAEEASPNRRGPEDEHVEPPEADLTVTSPGDIWVLGRHRLMCGDAKDPAMLAALMGEDRADMVFTDPPYNVPISGHVGGLGRVQHREFAEASGEMTEAQFTEFLRASLHVAVGFCKDGAIAYVCMDWRHLGEVLTAGHLVFSELKNICVWAKTNGGMGSFYRSQHELVLVWKVGTAPHTNTFGLGDKGRYRTNVWTYAGVNSFRAGRMEELNQHPTAKPVALVADAIRDVSHRGEVVLDVFGGSGSTLIAAQKTGRLARLMEIDGPYCDAIIERWQRLTGQSARRSSDDVSYNALKADLSSMSEVAA